MKKLIFILTFLLCWEESFAQQTNTKTRLLASSQYSYERSLNLQDDLEATSTIKKSNKEPKKTLVLGSKILPVLKIGSARMEGKQWYELGVGMTTSGVFSSSVPEEHYTNIAFGAGVEFSKDELSPKVMVGMTIGHILGLTINIQGNYYPKRQNFVLTPELGLQLMQIVHLMYGYQFGQISENENTERPNSYNHRISLFVTPALLFLR